MDEKFDSNPIEVTASDTAAPGTAVERAQAQVNCAESENCRAESREPADADKTQFADSAPRKTTAASAEIPTQPTVKVKPCKPLRVTRAGIALLVVCCLLVSAAAGIGGAWLMTKSGSSAGGPVMFESTELSATGTANTISEVVAAVEDTVVEITTSSVTVDSGWQHGYTTSGAGSGVIVSTDGYIVTCAHVVSSASQISVTLHDGSEYTAKIVGTDESNDIAVLKIDASGLTAAVLGTSGTLVTGEQVVAIGNPLGSLGGTVTDGIISATDREITLSGTTMTLLQTNAAVNPGNSGGGLFDMTGALVGIVNAKAAIDDVEGLGFAIPIDTARESVTAIIENGSVDSAKPALGVTVIEISSATSAESYGVSRLGVYIGNVNSGSAAEQAGLQVGDYIVSVNGTAISTNAEFVALLDECEIGDTVTLQIIRDEQMISVDVVLQAFNQNDY